MARDALNSESGLGARTQRLFTFDLQHFVLLSTHFCLVTAMHLPLINHPKAAKSPRKDDGRSWSVALIILLRELEKRERLYYVSAGPWIYKYSFRLSK